MNDQPPQEIPPPRADDARSERPDVQRQDLPQSEIVPRRPFHFIWIVPIVAALIAAFLGYRALTDRGPTITLSFNSADGLVAGQTRVKHKAVDLGTVRTINLSADMTHVEVRVEMRREAARVLTDHARFWVVRARLGAASVSGLDTLISGSYIELDPGTANGKEQKDFVGLEDPPAIRSDEPGRTFTVRADRVGSLASGSPVFYRDVPAGEVLGYDPIKQDSPVMMHVFVRAPFDQFVHDTTHFWNVSGLSVDLGGSGVQVHIASLQALLAGGLAFDTPTTPQPALPVRPNRIFRLYADEASANAASFLRPIRVVTYVDGSVRGLTVGAPVQLYGLTIGTVTGILLQFAPTGITSSVAIRMELQPDRLLRPEQISDEEPLKVSQALVDRGMRLQLQTTNYLTGQLAVEMVFLPDQPKQTVAKDTVYKDDINLPSVPGGLDSITSGLSEVTSKLARLPLDDIATSLVSALQGVSGVTNGPELKQVLTSLASTLSDVRALVSTTNTNLTPTLKRLPDIAQNLQSTAERASRLLGSLDTGYGGNSEVRRDIERLLVQVSDTARSVRLLADFLDQHPEALVRGRTDRAGER